MSAPGGQPAEDPLTDVSAYVRRSRIAVGVVVVAFVVVFSAVGLVTHGSATTGVPAGHRLRWFAAPLAGTTLVGDPNLDPPCTAARHDPRALNVCLDASRGPLVLAFFVTGASMCIRSVSAVQQVARDMAGGPVQFAAVAVHGGRAATTALVRRHRWTIPVAYDRDGSVGAMYDIAVCPLLELAAQGGMVRQRLIGGRWQSARALAARVRAVLLSAS